MLYRTEDLDNKFSDAFEFGWFSVPQGQELKLPANVHELDEDGTVIDTYAVSHEMFWDAFVKYCAMPGGGLNSRDTRTLADMYEDTDAADDDAILQLACFGEIRYG